METLTGIARAGADLIITYYAEDAARWLARGTGRDHHPSDGPGRDKPDDADRELLNQLQAGLAMVREPYAEIGSRIGMDQEEVLRRVQRLKDAASCASSRRSSTRGPWGTPAAWWRPGIRRTACSRPPASWVGTRA